MFSFLDEPIGAVGVLVAACLIVICFGALSHYLMVTEKKED